MYKIIYKENSKEFEEISFLISKFRSKTYEDYPNLDWPDRNRIMRSQIYDKHKFRYAYNIGLSSAIVELNFDSEEDKLMFLLK